MWALFTSVALYSRLLCARQHLGIKITLQKYFREPVIYIQRPEHWRAGRASVQFLGGFGTHRKVALQYEAGNIHAVANKRFILLEWSKRLMKREKHFKWAQRLPDGKIYFEKGSNGKQNHWWRWKCFLFFFFCRKLPGCINKYLNCNLKHIQRTNIMSAAVTDFLQIWKKPLFCWRGTSATTKWSTALNKVISYKCMSPFMSK